VKEIFLAMLKDISTVNTIADVMHVSQPLTFADAPVCAIEPPAGFEALAMAMTERCAITIMVSVQGGRSIVTVQGVSSREFLELR
jgi:hypothetical protein